MHNKINSKHLMFLIAGVSIVSMKTYPTILLRQGGRDTWIAVILAGLVMLGYAFIVMRIARATNEYNIHLIYRSAFGKVLGYAATALYMCVLFLSILESVSVEANVLHTSFSPKTPIWTFMTVSIVACAFVIKKGGSAVVTTVIVTITLITFSGITLSVLTQKYKDYDYLLPVMQHGLNKGFLLSIVESVGLMSAFSVIFPYLTEIKEKKKLTLHATVAMLFVVQIEIIAILGVLTTFSLPRAMELMYPKLTQTQLISYFGFLEAGEIFVMLQVVAGWFTKICITLLALVQMFRLLGKKAVLKSYLILAAALAVSMWSLTDYFQLKALLVYFSYIEFFLFFIMPLLAFLLHYLRYRLSPKHRAPSSENTAASSGPSPKGENAPGGSAAFPGTASPAPSPGSALSGDPLSGGSADNPGASGANS